MSDVARPTTATGTKKAPEWVHPDFKRICPGATCGGLKVAPFRVLCVCARERLRMGSAGQFPRPCSGYFYSIVFKSIASFEGDVERRRVASVFKNERAGALLGWSGRLWWTYITGRMLQYCSKPVNILHSRMSSSVIFHCASFHAAQISCAVRRTTSTIPCPFCLETTRTAPGRPPSKAYAMSSASSEVSVSPASSLSKSQGTAHFSPLLGCFRFCGAVRDRERQTNMPPL